MKIYVPSSHPCPSFLFLSVNTWSSPSFPFPKPISFVFQGVSHSFLSTNHSLAFLPRPQSFPVKLLFHSFIFYWFTVNHGAKACPRFNPFLCPCMTTGGGGGGVTLISHLFSFPPLFGAFLPHPPFIHVRFVALLLPSWLFCVSLFPLFPFLLQSLVMRCDKPLPCYHSNRVPVATQHHWC